MDSELERSSLRLSVALALLLTAGTVWAIRWSSAEAPPYEEARVARAMSSVAPSGAYKPVFRQDGSYWGFIADGYLFDAGGAYVGWVDTGRVWHRSGSFLGELVDGAYVLRDTMLTLSPMTGTVRRPPASPVPPQPAMGRMMVMMRTGWVDALDRQ
jgi:hypothetical protein